jgi:hypothetical protein
LARLETLRRERRRPFFNDDAAAGFSAEHLIRAETYGRRRPVSAALRWFAYPC